MTGIKAKSTSFSPSLPLVLLFLITLLVANANIYVPCLPFMREEFMASNFSVQFAILINPLMAIIVNLLAGFLGDLYGRRIVLRSGLILMLSGSLLCFLSSTIEMFLFGRLLQSIGDGTLFVIAIAILSDFFQKKKLGYYLGLNSILCSISASIAPLVGAEVLKLFGWRWNFFLIFVSFLIITVWLFHYLPETIKRKTSENSLFPNHYQSLVCMIKSPIFLFVTWLHSLSIGLSAAFDCLSPFLYIDTYYFSPVQFSFVKMAIVIIGILASFIYIISLPRLGLEKELLIGMAGSFLLTIVMGALFFHFLEETPYTLLAVFCGQSFCVPFISNVCTVKGIEMAGDKRGFSIALFCLTRNIFSTMLCFLAFLLVQDSFYPFLCISLFLLVFTLIMFICIKLLEKKAVPYRK